MGNKSVSEILFDLLSVETETIISDIEKHAKNSDGEMLNYSLEEYYEIRKAREWVEKQVEDGEV